MLYKSLSPSTYLLYKCLLWNITLSHFWCHHSLKYLSHVFYAEVTILITICEAVRVFMSSSFTLVHLYKKYKKLKVIRLEDKTDVKWQALNIFFSFSFQLGNLGATFFGRTKSGFIWHQLLPSCSQSSVPKRSKSYTQGALVGKSVLCLPWPPRLVPWACLKKRLALTSTKQLVLGRIWGLQ